jgi:hypothetical protein
MLKIYSTVHSINIVLLVLPRFVFSHAVLKPDGLPFLFPCYEERQFCGTFPEITSEGMDRFLIKLVWILELGSISLN